jgi:hypothetical protein
MIDPRGPRFAATLTAVLLAVTLLTGSGWLLALAAVLFATGALLGVQHTPYAWLFRHLVRPRLAPPTDLEDPRPPRFAQSVGLGFALVGLVGVVTGIAPLFYVATGMALGAAFLNAAFGYCLGCEVYLLLRRIRPSRGAAPTVITTPSNEEISA